MRAPARGMDRELMVGLFVLLGIFVVGIFSLKITDSPVLRTGTPYTVYLQDATGIFRNSKVKIAGINVGIVKDIELENGKAKLKLLLDKGYVIERGSYVMPRSTGILGDRFIEIVLPQNQDEENNLEKDGGKKIQDSSASSTSSAFLWLNALFPMAYAEEASAGTVPAQKSEVYHSGDVIPTKPGATTDDVMRKLSQIGDDVKVLAHDLKDIVHNNKGNIDDAIKKIRTSADNLDLILGDLSQKEVRSDLRDAIHGMKESIDNIKQITDKLNTNQGTIGKLINDPQAADQLVRALNSINEWLERVRRTEFIVDMNTNYLFGMHNAKTYLNLEILPRSSYGYLLGIVQDPGGRVTQSVQYISVNQAPATEIQTTNIDKSSFKFNFQFMRKIYHTTLRLGLFETTGGVGIDQELWTDHLYATAEAFDFGRLNDNAHVRALLRFQILDSFYIQGGGDDLCARGSHNLKNSFFGGIGLHFDDNDIKSLFFLLSGP